jgi:hypothetical protein
LNPWCERGDSNPHGFTRQILSPISGIDSKEYQGLSSAIYGKVRQNPQPRRNRKSDHKLITGAGMARRRYVNLILRRRPKKQGERVELDCVRGTVWLLLVRRHAHEAVQDQRVRQPPPRGKKKAIDLYSYMRDIRRVVSAK